MIELPEICLRAKTANPLSQLRDDESDGFICIGQVEKHWLKDIPKEDIYCKCWKGEGTDSIDFNDIRDLVDELFVIAQALHVLENIEQGEK